MEGMAFPTWNPGQPLQLNLNQTGGSPYSGPGFTMRADNVTLYREPGLMNQIGVVDAWTWEGGRGVRCEFWRGVGGIVPG